MPIIDAQSGTRIDEIADHIYRISTPVAAIPGGFTFNQYLIDDDEPLLFHTGLRRTFDLTRKAVATVIPVERLRYVSFSHVEADECGAMNQWLAAAPQAIPLCSRIAAMTSMQDLADRPPRVIADGETLSIGNRAVKWFDTPHLPHGWESGLILETRSSTLMCGDLFTQSGDKPEPLTKSDILGPSEALRSKLDYFARTKDTTALLEKLAAARPTTLACMHGSAWTGDAPALLRELAAILAR
jgi:flavorubredoxin